MLKVAVPNKGTLSEPAASMLREAGYRQRNDSRDLSVLDVANDVEFYFLRPKDIAVYVGSGELDLGITGRDLAADSGAPVTELASLGFGYSTFRYAGPDHKDWHIADLAGARIATSYPNLTRNDLAAHGIAADDGSVSIRVNSAASDRRMTSPKATRPCWRSERPESTTSAMASATPSWMEISTAPSRRITSA